MRHLQSNLLPLCLASFMRLVSLVISGMTLFSLAASLCPFTMTGNTTHRAKMVPEKNRQKVMVNYNKLINKLHTKKENMNSKYFVK